MRCPTPVRMTATWSSGRLPRRSSTSTPGEQAVVFLGESRHRLGPHPRAGRFPAARRCRCYERAGLPLHTPARRAAGPPPPAQQDRADGLDRLSGRIRGRRVVDVGRATTLSSARTSAPPGVGRRPPPFPSRTLTSSHELTQDPPTVNYYVDYLISRSAHPVVLPASSCHHSGHTADCSSGNGSCYTINGIVDIVIRYPRELTHGTDLGNRLHAAG
jgi:hypothetical protein